MQSRRHFLLSSAILGGVSLFTGLNKLVPTALKKKECAKNSKLWYQNGRLHRKDGPAIELIKDVKRFYR